MKGCISPKLKNLYNSNVSIARTISFSPGRSSHGDSTVTMKPSKYFLHSMLHLVLHPGTIVLESFLITFCFKEGYQPGVKYLTERRGRKYRVEKL